MNHASLLRLFTLAVLTVVVAACSANPAIPTVLPAQTQSATAAAGTGAETDALPGETNLARTDAQGMVEFVVTPLNLSSPGETLDFGVAMNTHSVDLSWNLAAQSALRTDTGLEVRGLKWPVGGGHHYEGTLAFPAKTAEGKTLLDGATTLTLNIRDAGAPERVFVWNLP